MPQNHQKTTLQFSSQDVLKLALTLSFVDSIAAGLMARGSKAGLSLLAKNSLKNKVAEQASVEVVKNAGISIWGAGLHPSVAKFSLFAAIGLLSLHFISQNQDDIKYFFFEKNRDMMEKFKNFLEHFNKNEEKKEIAEINLKLKDHQETQESTKKSLQGVKDHIVELEARGEDVNKDIKDSLKEFSNKDTSLKKQVDLLVSIKDIKQKIISKQSTLIKTNHHVDKLQALQQYRLNVIERLANELNAKKNNHNALDEKLKNLETERTTTGENIVSKLKTINSLESGGVKSSKDKKELKALEKKKDEFTKQIDKITKQLSSALVEKQNAAKLLKEAQAKEAEAKALVTKAEAIVTVINKEINELQGTLNGFDEDFTKAYNNELVREKAIKDAKDRKEKQEASEKARKEKLEKKLSEEKEASEKAEEARKALEKKLSEEKEALEKTAKELEKVAGEPTIPKLFKYGLIAVATPFVSFAIYKILKGDPFSKTEELKKARDDLLREEKNLKDSGVKTPKKQIEILFAKYKDCLKEMVKELRKNNLDKILLDSNIEFYKTKFQIIFKKDYNYTEGKTFLDNVLSDTSLETKSKSTFVTLTAKQDDYITNYYIYKHLKADSLLYKALLSASRNELLNPPKNNPSIDKKVVTAILDECPKNYLTSFLKIKYKITADKSIEFFGDNSSYRGNFCAIELALLAWKTHKDTPIDPENTIHHNAAKNLKEIIQAINVKHNYLDNVSYEESNVPNLEYFANIIGELKGE